MMNFNNWPIRYKLILPLLLVVLLGGGGIIFSFARMIDVITTDALPEERALNGIRRASLELLAEYREFMIIPSDSTLREIDELQEEIEIFEAAFERLTASNSSEYQFVAAIESAEQNLKQRGDEAIDQRRRLLDRIEKMEAFEEVTEHSHDNDSVGVDEAKRAASGAAPAVIGPVHELGMLFQEYLSELREFALAPSDETRQKVAEVEAGLTQFFQVHGADRASEAGGQALNDVYREQIQQVLEAGRATVSLSEALLITLEALEESEDELLEALGEARAVVAQETDEAFETGFTTVATVIFTVLALLILIGYLVSQRIARPVRTLADTVIRLGEGDLSARAEVASTDEIGGLAATFNQMAENLQSNVERRQQAEEQLRQAQKMEAVGQLTGGVAHDFNNLLAVILGNAELLEDELEDEQAERLEPLIRAAKRGAELTDRLLAFSRKQALRPRSLDLGELVGGMHSLLSRSLGETINIVTKGGPDLWDVTADSGQLENAVLNLAINARAAMPDGGTLTIEWANAVLDQDFVAENPGAIAGDYAFLAVCDTGVGMSKETLKHAFEPFFTTKPVGEGTGLGLSMVYGFAKQSGGYVTLQSEEGKGTTAKLYLPRAEIAVDRPQTTAAEPLPAGRDEVILVLEDDTDVRDLVVRILGGLNYRVIEAPDAQAALAVLSAEDEVDLLLSDVVLPGGMGGPELAETAKKSHPALNVLFMSGYTGRPTNGSGQLDPDAVLLSKPFPSRELAEKVRTALGH